MTTPLPPQPNLRSIAIGVLIVAVGVVLVCSAGSVLKWVSVPFLAVPRALGLIGSVRADEIVTIPLDTTPTVVTFPRPETYAVYVSDLNLLEIALMVEASRAAPWLSVQSAPSGEAVPVETIRRGLMPFDEPRASGRPVYRFAIPAPGTYVLGHPRRMTAMYLVPDRTTGKEGVIVAFFAGEVFLLALPFIIIFGRPWLRRRQAWRAHQRTRREASDAVMRRHRERGA
jgi:hypothetical protein